MARRSRTRPLQGVQCPPRLPPGSAAVLRTGRAKSEEPVTRVCRWSVRAFALAYVGALGLYAIGTLGLFGQSRDPLAGVFLVPLGLPWNRVVDLAPEPLWPWLAAAAPALNLALLAAACRLVASRRHEARTWTGLRRKAIGSATKASEVSPRSGEK